MMERSLMTVSEILHMDQTGTKLLLRRGQYPFKMNLTGYYKPEWGLIPAHGTSDMPINEMSIVYYMTYDELMDSIDKKANKQISDMNKEQAEMKEAAPELSGLEQVANKLYSLTGDLHCAELVLNKKYKELFPYMERYKKIISKYELQTMLEPFAE